MVSRLMQLIALDRFKLKVSGLEKLPKSGPYIISSNHQSYLDPLILASVLPPDVFLRTFAVGTSDIFGKGLMRRLARSIKVVVVDPDANLVPAMRAGAYGLRHGMALILYPEGERSIDGTAAESSRRARPFSRFTCRCRLCRWRLRDSTKHGRAISHSRFHAAEDGDWRPDHAASGIRGVRGHLREDTPPHLKATIVGMWETLRKPQ